MTAETLLQQMDRMKAMQALRPAPISQQPPAQAPPQAPQPAPAPVVPQQAAAPAPQQAPPAILAQLQQLGQQQGVNPPQLPQAQMPVTQPAAPVAGDPQKETCPGCGKQFQQIARHRCKAVSQQPAQQQLPQVAQAAPQQTIPQVAQQPVPVLEAAHQQMFQVPVPTIEQQFLPPEQANSNELEALIQQSKMSAEVPVNQTPTAPASFPQTLAGSEPHVPIIPVLYIDIAFEKETPDVFMALENLCALWCREIAQENQVANWRLLDFGKSSDFLATKAEAYFQTTTPGTSVVCNSSSKEFQACQTVLRRNAHIIVKGI